jgi:hypothetical protein
MTVMIIDTVFWYAGAALCILAGVLAVLLLLDWVLNKLDPEWEDSWDKGPRPPPGRHPPKPNDIQRDRERADDR